jgi:hypothetical protein
VLISEGQDTNTTATYKEYSRWNSFWGNRIGSSDINSDLLALNTALLSMFEDRELICDGSATHPNEWSFSGHTEDFNNRNGRLISVYVKDDLSYVLAGSKGGGLWKGSWNTTDQIYDWVCLTDNTKIPSFGIHGIAVNPLDDNTIFIATGKFNGKNLNVGYGLGVLKSYDGGLTWDKTGLTWDLNSPQEFLQTVGIFYHPTDTNILFAFDGHKLHKSSNAGITFTQITLPSNISSNRLRDLEFLPANNSVIMLSTDGTDGANAKLFKSTNTGDTWTEVNLNSDFNIPVSSDRIDIASSDISTNRFYVSFSTNGGTNRENKDSYLGYYDNSTGIYHTFNILTGLTNGYWYNDLVCSKVDANILYLAGIRMDRIDISNPLSVQTNRIDGNQPGFGGAVHADNRKLFVVENANEDVLFSANDGGLSFSSNVRTASTANPQTWTHSSKGLNITEIYGFDITTNGDNILYGSLDNGTLGKRDESWIARTGGDGVRVICNKFGDNDLFYAQQNSNTQWFFNQNLDVVRQISCTDLGPWERDMDVDAVGNFYISRHVAGSNIPIANRTNNLFRIDRDIALPNSNCNAAEIINSTNEWQNVFVIGSAPSNANVLYYGYSDPLGGTQPLVLYKTENAQDANPTWTNQSLLQKSDYRWSGITDIVVDPNNENHVWVVTGSYIRSDNKRVLFSDNGGEDYSNGLTSWVVIDEGLTINSSQDMIFPVNSVVLDHFTGGMYIGSDIGVFFNPNPKVESSPWQCYNKSLPSAVITDLKIDYCNRKLFASTFGRGLWEVDLADVPPVNLEITSNTTWNNTVVKIINQNIVVKSGNTLTLNSELLLPSSSKITVEKGAKFIIDGGFISTRCNDLWAGIFVEGDKTISQLPFSNQGYVEIKNNGTLEHAKTAVTLCGLDASGNEDHNKSGGILIADGAIFVNNWRDISFTGYAHAYTTTSAGIQYLNNKSSIKNSAFSTSDEYKKAETDIWPHITMWGVVWLDIQGCTFTDNRWTNSINDRQFLRDGIYSMDASYRINRVSSFSMPYGTSAVGAKNEFTNIRYAIQSVDNLANWNNKTIGRPSSIVDANFDCLGGVLHSGVESAIIKRCTLTINGYNTPVGGFREIDAYGIYVDNCNDFQIGGNHLFSDWSQDPVRNAAAGFVVTNNWDSENEIYKNYFDDFLLGTEAIGYNRDDRVLTHPDKGFQYNCNEFASISDNEIDMLVMKDLINQWPPNFDGIPDQGADKNPASNLFGDYFTVNSMANIEHSNTIAFKYFHHTAPPSERVVPGVRPNPLDNEDARTVLANRSCPDNTNKGIAIGAHEKAEINNDQLIMILKRDSIIELSDGGNTDDVLNKISTVNANSLPQLLDELHSYSPFLSIHVLTEIGQSLSPFTHEDIRDIMFANPHSGRSSAVVSSLSNRTDNFPQIYIDQIDSVGNLYSSRDRLFAETYAITKKYEYALNDIIRRALNDDTEDHFDEIIEPLLIASNDPHDKYKLASLYDARLAHESADEVLSNIPISIDLSPIKLEYHNDFVSLRNLIKSWVEMDKNLSNLEPSDIVQLLSYRTKTNGIQNYVLPLLLMNNATTYLPPIYHPFLQSTSAKTTFEEDKNVEQEQLTELDLEIKLSSNSMTKVILYPNPTQKLLNISYEIAIEFTEANFEIYDLKGRLIVKEEITKKDGIVPINVSSYRNGTYVFKLYIDDKLTHNSNFVVTR